MPVTPTDPFGIPTGGFTPYGAMDAMYPYLTYGPNMAFNLLDMQTRANMQGQLANQQMGWNLAQAGGSGNLMDNFARQLYLGGQGPQPGRYSALAGLPSPWIQPINAAQQFGQTYGQLPPWMQNNPQGVFGGAAPPPAGVNWGGTGPGSGSIGANVDPDALPYLKAGDSKTALAILRQKAGLPASPNLPTVGGARMPPTAPTWSGSEPVLGPLPKPGEPGYVTPLGFMGGGAGGGYNLTPQQLQQWGHPTTQQPNQQLAAMQGFAGGGSLGPGESAIVGEVAPEVVRFENGKVVVSPIKYGMQQGGALDYDPSKPYEPPDDTNVTDLPFFKSLQSGTVGPAWTGNIPRPTAPELGINEGVKLPFEAANTFQRSSPMAQQNMLQLWQSLGIPPEWAQYWTNAATPGFRQGGRGLGY